MTRSVLLCGLSLISLPLACADAPSAVEPTPDAGIAPVPLPAIPGGGTTGGSILGRLVVHVLSAGQAVPGVLVTVDTGDGREEATTDEAGRIELRRPGLRGPATITALPPNGPYYTLAGVDAAGVSLDLAPGPAERSAEAFITGAVVGWDRLPAPNGSQVRVGEVRPIVRNLLAASFEWPQSVRPGSDVPQNVVADANELGAYRLRADATNTTGVYVRAGLSGSATERPPTFAYLAFDPQVMLTAGATVTADLSLSVPVDQTIQVGVDRQPDLPFVAILPVWRLKPTALLAYANAIPVSPADQSISTLAPNPTAYPGSELVMVAVATDGQGQQTVRWSRFSGPETSLPELLPLPTPSVAGGRSLSVDGRAADIVQVLLYANGGPAWRIDVVGPARQSAIEWPQVPSGWADPVPGERFYTVTTLDFGDFDPDNVSFNQLSIVLDALAFGFATLTL